MRYDQIDRTLARSLSRQVMTGLAVSVLLVGGAFGVSAMTEISGAVVSSGKLIVEGRPKDVQHLDGGTIHDILVVEGQAVVAGQVLFRLDPTVVEANLNIVDNGIVTLQAQEARLEAEVLGNPTITFPDELIARESDPRIAVLMTGQRDLMSVRSMTREGERNQHLAQISQLSEKIRALQAQRKATEFAITLAEEELASKEHLADLGLVRETEHRSAKRMRADLEAELASLDAQVAEAHTEQLRRELDIARIEENFREEVLTRLDENRSQLAQLVQEQIAARDRHSRLQIRAPSDGYLHELAVHTSGQVISPGERLVTLVDTGDRLIVETRLPPQQVDQVFPEQYARLRFSGLDQRTTPQVDAQVLDVAPDSSIDPMTGAAFYMVRLSVDEAQLARVEGSELRPGMPVEVFIETYPRTILSYLIKPVVDQIQHAFREK